MANNVVRVSMKRSRFFYNWLLFLRPMHGMTKSQMQVAAEFLRRRDELARKTNDEGIINGILLSNREYEKIEAKFGITRQYLRVVMTHLKKARFFTEGGINLKYVPMIGEHDDRFRLMFDFNIDNNEDGRDGESGQAEEAVSGEDGAE